MGLSGPLLKYVLLLVVVFAYFYYRMIKGRRRRSELRGRERLHAAFRQRRLERLSSAATWEDRRRLRADPHGGRRIKPELLQGRPESEKASGADESPAADGPPAADGQPGGGSD